MDSFFDLLRIVANKCTVFVCRLRITSWAVFLFFFFLQNIAGLPFIFIYFYFIYFLCHLGFKSKQYGQHEQQAIISLQPSGGKM